VAATLGCYGCSASEYIIEVRARYPDDVPLTNLTITALPFDRDALRDSLAEASGIPRPDFQDLESELASYTRPDLSGLTEASLPWQAIHDSVRHLADSLNLAGPDSSPQYARAYARLRDLYPRLARSAVDRDAAIREQVGDDRELALRAAAAADSLRAWEATAFARFPELADSVLARVSHGIHGATTDHDGVAEFALAPGRWWLVATWVDAENPFREYHWNIGVAVRRFGSRSVPLFAGNGEMRWRY
jgi:hypothetical protein